ncbi:MAG: hypothetical protein HGA35_02660 [Erysipelotrichaceae bacterium]|nr:hypothetical protein [Erysipelotrichaceae bacterium]
MTNTFAVKTYSIFNLLLFFILSFSINAQDLKGRITERNDKNELLVSYPQGIAAVTPGQEAVFYLNDICLGGGVIDEIYRNNKSLTSIIAEVKHA